MSGTAADELFTGYYDHHLAYLADVRPDAAHHARSLAAWKAHIQPEVRNPFLRDPELFARDASFRDHIYLDAEGFSKMLTRPLQASRSFGSVKTSPIGNWPPIFGMPV